MCSQNVHRYSVMLGIPSYLCFLLCSGISQVPPQLYYDKEQNIYLYDNTANNYLFEFVLTTFSSEYRADD